jgi:hypothetical protein
MCLKLVIASAFCAKSNFDDVQAEFTWLRLLLSDVFQALWIISKEQKQGLTSLLLKRLLIVDDAESFSTRMQNMRMDFNILFS